MMFFDKIKLSKKSWHYRLQCHMFGSPPFLSNFCPYFWLTIFCLIVFVTIGPFVFIGKKVAKFCVKMANFVIWVLLLVEKAFSFLDEKICAPIAERHYRSLSDEDIYTLTRKAGVYWDDNGNLWSKRNESNGSLRTFRKWRDTFGDGWQDRVKEIIRLHKEWEKREEQREVEQLEAARERLAQKKKAEQRRKKLLTKIVLYTKWIVTPVVLFVGVFALITIVAGLGYLLFPLGKLICAYWNPSAILVGVKQCFIAVAIILVLAAITAILYFSCRKLIRCSSLLLPRLPNISIKEPVVRTGKALVAPFQIFVDYIKVFKQNNCPAIIWEEKDED